AGTDLAEGHEASAADVSALGPDDDHRGTDFPEQGLSVLGSRDAGRAGQYGGDENGEQRDRSPTRDETPTRAHRDSRGIGRSAAGTSSSLASIPRPAYSRDTRSSCLAVSTRAPSTGNPAPMRRVSSSKTSSRPW